MNTLPLTDSGNSVGALKPAMRRRHILTAIFFLVVGPALLFIFMSFALRYNGLGASAEIIQFYYAGKIIAD
jgi:hypothetical protein